MIESAGSPVHGPRAARPAPGILLALGLIALAGAVVRLFRLGNQVIIDDEWHALNVVHDAGYGFIFGHFGTADHSIPMALYFELLANTIGLGEWGMRLPSLMAGIATVVVVPLALRRWLDRSEILILATLIAISPLLINFSRTARPYALIALLIGLALPLAWRWWREGHWRHGAGWIGCGVLAAWLNPLTIVISGAPLLWFAADALIVARRRGDRRALARTAGAGAALLLPVLALLATPLYHDAISLLTKASSHAVSPGTVGVALSLFSGLGSTVLVALTALVAAAGFVMLWRRDDGFARFVLLVASVGSLCVVVTGAAWIKHGLVLARYLIGLLPFYLALVAIGLNGLIERAARLSPWPTATKALGVAASAALLLALGPVPEWYRHYNQFTGHLSYQFDYDRGRNVIARILDAVPVEDFYREIAQAHPDGNAVIVEAPWHLESFWNPLYRYQRVHGQRVLIGFVNGVCAPRFYGELDAATAGLDFRNFVFLDDLLAGRARADYLVLRLGAVNGARSLPAATERCVEAAAARFGAPWRETPEAVVFRIRQAH